MIARFRAIRPRGPERSDAVGPASDPEVDLALPPPDGLAIERVEWNGERRLVISYPLPEPKWPATLTQAEREIATLLLDGYSNAQIAEQRGTSERTVVNQVASIFKKARVASRTELAARVFGS